MMKVGSCCLFLLVPGCDDNVIKFCVSEEGEMFQVKKSSHSKKVMKMMDKERKKKKYKDSNSTSNAYNEHQSDSNQSVRSAAIDTDNSGKRNNSHNSNSIQTEIRTDDFVVRLLLSISMFYAKLLFSLSSLFEKVIVSTVRRVDALIDWWKKLFFRSGYSIK